MKSNAHGLPGRIRSARKRAKLSQQGLAAAAKVTTGAVYRWESGRAVPTIAHLAAVAKVTRTPFAKLSGVA